MADESLVAWEKWLSQYQEEVPAAQRRLEEAARTGSRVKLIETRGAARLPIRTVEDMAQNQADARVNVTSANNGKMTASPTDEL